MTEEGFAYSLCSAISICTLIVSIGPMITKYYFLLAVLMLIIIIVTIEVFVRYNIREHLPQIWPRQNPLTRKYAVRKTRTISCPDMDYMAGMSEGDRTRKMGKNLDRGRSQTERRRTQKKSIFGRHPKMECYNDTVYE